MSKKIVFVIVEGPSDDAALGLILSRVYAKNTIHVEIIHGDITSDYNVCPSNIIKKITGCIQDYASSNHFTKNDFLEVIHIVDTDGAFIDIEHVIYNEECKRPFYDNQCIYTNQVENIIDRNKWKRDNLNRISSLKFVWGVIPYRCYYMSCNLDHVLCNSHNISDDEKEKNAYQFAKKYKDDIGGFLRYMTQSSFSIVEDYRNSWDFIKEDMNSLKRYSNLGIAFKGIIENKKN